MVRAENIKNTAVLDGFTIRRGNANNGNDVFQGGGMLNYSSSPTLANLVFSNNVANTVGGGIANVSSNPALKNVILWGDTANSNPEIYNSSSSPTITYSIVQGGYTDTGNLNLDPKLGPLQNNGGFTQTMALGVGSPAINVGTNIGCPATDQRGVIRPQGGQCDIGAYEFIGNTDVKIGGSLKGSYYIPSGQSMVKSYSGVNGGPVVVHSDSGAKIIASYLQLGELVSGKYRIRMEEKPETIPLAPPNSESASRKMREVA